MVYIYIPTRDGSPLFLESAERGECWHESPLHATMFPDGDVAIADVCMNCPDISSAVEVMSDDEARAYL